jgi:hypothetical protein
MPTTLVSFLLIIILIISLLLIVSFSLKALSSFFILFIFVPSFFIHLLFLSPTSSFHIELFAQFIFAVLD